jgi:hypothetical protein
LNNLVFSEVGHDAGDATANFGIFILIILVNPRSGARLRELLSGTTLCDFLAADTVHIEGFFGKELVKEAVRASLVSLDFVQNCVVGLFGA